MRTSITTLKALVEQINIAKNAPLTPYTDDNCKICDYPHPWSDKTCNREKGHGGEHACIERYSGRQNEWWKGGNDE
jgi:hypothetical protein